MKVVVDDGVYEKVFVAAGDKVAYDRTTTVHFVPGLPGTRWRSRAVTVHCVSWETVAYE